MYDNNIVEDERKSAENMNNPTAIKCVTLSFNCLHFFIAKMFLELLLTSSFELRFAGERRRSFEKCDK